MRRLTIVGLSMLVILAVGAIAVSSAWAEPPHPEWEVCGKAAKEGKTYLGRYTSKECTTASKVGSGGKYELLNVPEHAKKLTLEGKGGASTLDTYVEGIGVVGTVTCEASTSSLKLKKWRYLTWRFGIVVFNGCKSAGESCSSTEPHAKKGQITTGGLMSWLVYLKPGVPGIITKPAEGPTIASFTCGATKFTLGGSLLGIVGGSLGHTSATETETFSVNGSGEQQYATYEGSEEEPNGLVAEITGTGTLSAGLESTVTTKGEKVEVVEAGTPESGPTCTGSNIVAAGASAQRLAQQDVWNPQFNLSHNATACSGSQGDKGEPTVTFESTGSGAGLSDWGEQGHKFEGGRVALVASDEPVGEAQKAEIEANETISTPNTVQTVPVLQEAVAVIVNLPSNCTATSTAAPGRLVLDNVTLEGIFRGTITKWSQIKDDGDELTGGGCDAESEITRVARLDQSGTTHIFKRYLALVDPGPFETEKGEDKTWSEISEGLENTTWSKTAGVTRPGSAGGDALIAKVAATPGSIGYANLADVRANGGFSQAGIGGAGTGKFWAEIQNSGLSTSKKATYADPSTNGDVESAANANCAGETYSDGGSPFPPASTADTWNEVTTQTKETHYSLCGLTYDMALSKYSVYPGTSSVEAATAGDFLDFVLDAEAEGGQALIAGHDYEALPSTVVGEAREGAALVGF